ncbi:MULTISPECIES: monoheme c-type cytochrome [Campylobacter]|uniref:Molybdopterin-containing oxidoreductase II, DMSO/TMAO/BSO reductase family, monoheme c-type cytochrome n=1 Tax=Campylobacter subantarcticus LMG 24374 TaxID=1388751 RepID=A0A0A8HBM8_9BACT|nr:MULTISPECIES: monoheme c-type cytochrome [Campylobacter]AJC91466.1 molybdopterin-containing oxidoreductase II, DMSO/TMAO/BSO reductase family, monoheme c-type cytochrome [Campylobacter subantarcticus LMG 24374]EAJ1260940.1 monoheme c-type cytochrome [Campylobacter lari]EAJ1262148.1 monoheme c-type cytochrome [Campylobacter lari]QOR01090.1 monoheme c-type cytochrome [Campylobacter sp. 2014D-0216]
MKKIFITCLALASLVCAREEFFTSEVNSLYLSKNDTKAVGRLLPTNPFEVLKVEGDKALIKITGYVNPASASVLYYNDSQRIIVAAFSKNTKLDFKTYTKSKNGKWDKATIEVWTDKKDFAKSDKEMFIKAKELYMNNCGICHSVHKESEFTANGWPATFRSMVNRTGIDKKDHWLVIQYLQKNAKDFKEAK